MKNFNRRFVFCFFLTLLTVGFIPNLIAQSYSFNYLGNFSADGTPLYFARRDTVSATFLSRINASLPERYPVPTYHPEYIRPNAVTDIILQDSAEVWVTFVAEGAGYKNVLGFYTYSLDAPPTSRPTNVTIAFPNVSASGSGGSLKAGDKVKLGNFSARTGIGWVLIADGFRNGGVTTGNWVLYGNPRFNPESDTAKRHHNVQLLDTLGKIVIGFEDIRRDNSGCDNDFNDAIFYVSATPSTAIATQNLLTTAGFSGAAGSGNDGGLESNGNLAGAIAARNFQRFQQSQANDAENLDKLARFVNTNGSAILRGGEDLRTFLPQQPIEDVAAFITTPNDLKAITNAQQVFAVDYFIDKDRQAAILATQTENTVYEHTKVICDRLKGATLMAMKVVNLEETPFIVSTFKQEDGSIEYATSFSVYQRGDSFGIESHWTVEEFSEKTTFYNFQVWSKTRHWTLKIAQEIKALFANRFRFKANNNPNPKVPIVFVTNGAYDKGKLTLKIKNEAAASALILRGSLTRSETESRQPFTQNISLSGATEQTVDVQIGQIFDAGFRLENNRDDQADALYLADGAWGLDYAQNGVQVQRFETKESNVVPTNTLLRYDLPRSPTVKGRVKTYISLFRALRPTGKATALTGLQQLSFDLEGNTPTGFIEVVLVKKSITDWSKQYRTMIALPKNATTFNVLLSQFKNGTEMNLTTEDISTVVFVAKGNQQEFLDFSLTINNLQFNSAKTNARLTEPVIRANPNPTNGQTVLNFSLDNGMPVQVNILNAHGALIGTWSVEANKGSNQLPINLENNAAGVYAIQLTTERGVQVVKLVKY